jgi:signal transduction histidine kinase
MNGIGTGAGAAAREDDVPGMVAARTSDRERGTRPDSAAAAGRAPTAREPEQDEGPVRQKPPWVVRAYVLVLLAAVAAHVPAVLTAPSVRPWEMIVWVALLGTASLLTVPLLQRTRIDAGLDQPVVVAAAVVLPPPLAVLVGFLGFSHVRMVQRQTSVWFSLFNKAQVGIATGVASQVARWVEGELPGAVLPMIVATGAAIVVHDLANIALVSVFVTALGRTTLVGAVRGNLAPFPRFASNFFLVGLLALLVVIAYEQVNVLAVALIAVPLALGYNAMRAAKESEDRARELARQVRELEMLNVLGEQLLSAGSVRQAHAATQEALRLALGDERVIVSLDGELPPGLQPVPMRAAGSAAIGVAEPLTEGSAAIVEAIGDLLGVTLQRLELNAQLTEVQQARAELAGRILEEGTRERSRIALEIHDDVLPFLAGAEIQADNVRSALAQSDPAVAERLATATSSAVNGGIRQLRQVLDALRKQIIVPGGLVPGLREAVEDLRVRDGIDGRVDVAGELPKLPLAVEILVLETVRGCLTNVARHAGATSVRVGVKCNDSSLHAMVCDDGSGFDPDAVPAGHHGLSLMAQRVELARGRFGIDSAPGRGTCVSMEVPL